MTSPVTARDRSDARNTAARPTSSGVMFARNGAVSANEPYIFLKPAMPAAASVRIGPAEIALTRIPDGPRSAAR